MKHHLQNATCGVLDYAAYPLGMIAAAPLLIRGLGATHFGIWAFTMAGINTGAILASGFGDANIQQIAAARGVNDTARVESCVRTTLGIHLLLGALLSVAAYLAAPFAARHVVSTENDVRLCTTSLQIGSFCVLLRALETVVVSTQRAFERYAESIRISATMRVLSLAVATILALRGAEVPTVVASSAALLSLGTLAQFVRLTTLLPRRCLIPGYERKAGRSLLRLGMFTWLQATGSAVFGQVDRLFVGIAFGAVAVGAYSLCIQLAQPIAGVAASAFHFIFPMLARTGAGQQSRIARPLILAFACNVLLVTTAALILLFVGGHLLRAWTTPAVAHAGGAILPVVVLASALAGLAVTGIYAMLALGKAVPVVTVTLLSGLAMLLSMEGFIHRFGILGVAASRLLFGATSLAIYIPLGRVLRGRAAANGTTTAFEWGGAEGGA